MSTDSTIVETYYNTHYDYSLQLNRWLLIPIGAWPYPPTTSKSKRIISSILNIVCYTSVILTLIPSVLHMILVEQTVYTKMQTLGPVSHWVVSTVNYTTLLLRKKDIRYCMDHMETDWRIVTRMEDQQVMLENARFGRYVAVICAMFMQGGVLCYCLVTVVNTEIIQVGNETRVVHSIPCLVYKELLNVDESPTNEIVLFMQVWSAIIANSSTTGIFSLAAVLAAHACGQLNVLMTWITEFVDQAKNGKGNVYLKEIGLLVEHHQRTLNFISYIEDVMNRICFLELLRCTLDICLIGYYVLTAWAEGDTQGMITYIMMFVSIGFNIFILCYIGEKLTQECKKVGEVTYMTDWYYLPERSILDLILIIARSNVVIHITAGKLVHMSIYTFGDVIKTGFAYLNLLSQMTL